ncbi:hypothetical protein FH508_0011210 [Lysinibacillus sp. CD3-6]|uniref:hypothetical protein n=1 Tax=Lysinibacillus sp. CD3-6 TaxID=2892541 RepID=UPI0011726FB8|nr:hypothetical protein [Lysinibacillus sp. CD3-6]UED82438.1 hypothetical protein FH508_0011210 [Lysinibacillus sp. CD3-6]
MIDYFERTLRLTDLEVWTIRIQRVHYSLVIVDERRKATVEELEIADFIMDEDEQRTNYVSVSVYSESDVQDGHIEPLAELAKQLTEHLALAHCDVITKFYTEQPEIAIDRLLVDKYGYQLADISLEKLWHLTQD